jgi:hypothetical protein
MHTFAHQGKTYILINGKEYYLIRGYRTSDNRKADWMFLQVYGKVPLHPEDLPSDEWEIIKTKGKAEYPIFTAYNPKCFDYRSLKEDQYKRLYFIGMTERGSLFLALNFLRETFKIKVDNLRFEQTLKTLLADGNYRRNINQIEDQGNTAQKAYSIEFDRWKMNEEGANELFQIKKEGG